MIEIKTVVITINKSKRNMSFDWSTVLKMAPYNRTLKAMNSCVGGRLDSLSRDGPMFYTLPTRTHIHAHPHTTTVPKEAYTTMPLCVHYNGSCALSKRMGQ
ncbi:hypothetical protein NQD34_014354 [Periophthalmus magnuspinnatus]|nr:hypothetical protein NQD34_014354 [Periophthalmus magnuspinnatus]